MGRVYTAVFEDATVSAIQDVFELNTPSSSTAKLISCHLGQSSDAGDAQAEMLSIRITRYSGGVSGSGGSTPTARPHNVGHAASGVTVDANNTTQNTGTATVVWSGAFNVQAGWFYQPIPEEMFWMPPSAFLAIELPVAPADDLTMSGSITFEEFD